MSEDQQQQRPYSAEIRPGDMLRIRHGFPLSRLDENLIDFLRVNFETDSPGLARVVSVAADGIVVELWGHLFRAPSFERSKLCRRLTWPERIFAPERIGEALLRRERRLAQVSLARQRRPRPKINPARALLRLTRGKLPILESIGGRIRSPMLRRAKAWIYGWLGHWSLMPWQIGRVDNGLLIDRIGIAIELSHCDRKRSLWLDRILLHKNDSIHLIGIDIELNEQRSFRLDRIDGLSIPTTGAIDPHQLYWELQALCMSRKGWQWYWNRRHSESP